MEEKIAQILSTQYEFDGLDYSHATNLKLADQIIDLLAKEGYGKIIPCQKSYEGCFDICEEQICDDVKRIFEPIKG